MRVIHAHQYIYIQKSSRCERPKKSRMELTADQLVITDCIIIIIISGQEYGTLSAGLLKSLAGK